MIELSKINEYNSYLINIRKLSDNTAYSYMGDVKRFTSFLEKNGILNFENVTKNDIINFLAALEENGMSRQSLARYTSSINIFYNWLKDMGMIADNPASDVQMTENKTKLPTVLSSKEINKLLETPDLSDLKGIRDKAMLETLYATGLRVTELISLDVSDVNLVTSLITCRGKTVRTIPVYPKAAKALRDYLETSRMYIAQPSETALFVNIAGVRMTRQGFWKKVKYYTRLAGITNDITPRILRHSFAAHLLESGADINVLREMLGHSAIATTQKYARVVKKKLKDVYFSSHPRASAQ